MNEAVGRHCIAELYGGSPHLLNDEEHIKEALKQAAKRSGAHLISIISHQFKPQGVTALALLSESHISIHTWPETGYAAVDAFTCGEQCNPEVACEHLKTSLGATKSILKMFDRSVPNQIL